MILRWGKGGEGEGASAVFRPPHHHPSIGVGVVVRAVTGDRNKVRNTNGQFLPPSRPRARLLGGSGRATWPITRARAADNARAGFGSNTRGRARDI